MADMAIDRADWHWDSAEKLYRETHGITGELTDEQENEIWLLAGDHIGMFLRWIIENGFEGEEADPDHCEDVRRGRMTGAEFLMWDCDGKLWDEDIREDILPFAKAYYEKAFLHDYGECCGGDTPCYGFISGEEDYARLRERIDAAFEAYYEEDYGNG